MNKPEKNTMYKIEPAIRFRIVDKEAVIVRQDTNEIHALNETASRALELIQQGNSFERIIEQLLVEFDIDQTTLEQDLNACLVHLESLGIIASTGT